MTRPSSVLHRISGLWPDTFGGALRALGIVALLWALAARLLSWLAPGLGGFYRVFVFSECVGMTMLACVLASRRVPAIARLAPLTRWLFTGIVSIPTGFLVGHQIAFLLLGEPLRLVGYEHVSAIPVAFTVLFGGGGLYFFATREQLAKEAAARSEAQRLAMESQLRLLRAQLEPHMLFNTLANVRSLLREDVDRAESMIDQVIVYLRSALAASQTESVSLGREFAQLRAYLEIMALRMGPRLAWRLDLPAALEGTQVPPMLLQPLVENAIKHGLEPKVGAGRIEVSACAVAGGIEIRVSDSGLGLPPDDDEAPAARPAGTSYGLQHVRDRLRAVYGPAATLRLERIAPTGVCAVVRLPA
jgi:signal transduction histidine kinase